MQVVSDLRQEQSEANESFGYRSVKQVLSNPVPRRGADYTLLSYLTDLIGIFAAIIFVDALFNSALLMEAGAITALPIGLSAAVLWTALLVMFDVYKLDDDYSILRELSRIAIISGLMLLTFMGVLYMTQITVPANALLSLLGLNIGFALGWRVLAYVSAQLRFARQLMQPNRVLIVGTNEMARRIAKQITEGKTSNLMVAGYVSEQEEQVIGKPLRILGTIKGNIFKMIEENEIDEVIIALQHKYFDGQYELLEDLRYSPVPVRVLPDYISLDLYHNTSGTLDHLPLVHLVDGALTNRQRLMKRAFDIVIAATVLLLTLPLLLIVAIAIKLDSRGPVFFLQERMGERGHRFKIFKFRSMVQNAESLVDDVKIVDENGNTIHKIRGDFRVTNVGKVIRKLSLDELPQLLNVIRGDMSLVGPRPEVLSIIEQEYESWQYERFSVPQGITGWWQVNGRSDNPCHLSTDQDIYYIRNYSLWLDIKILLMTVPALLKGKGAF